MKVSICVPIYGVEKYIGRCAVSLFEQTYQDLEYIFVNDCTNDKSLEILESVIARYPKREKDVKVINHDFNMGLAAARNTSIEYATGDFIFIVDSDDYIPSNAIEQLVIKQVEGDFDVVFGRVKRFFPTFSNTIKYPAVSSSRSLLILVLKNEIDHYIWGKLIRRSTLFDHKIRVEKGMSSGEDADLLIKILLYSHKISTIPDTVYYYDYSNPNSVSSSATPCKSEEYYKHYQILYRIVNEQGDEELSDACKIGELRWLVAKQMSAAILLFPEYYAQLKDRQNRIDKKYYKDIKCLYRPILYLNNPSIVKYIYGTLAKFYHLYRDVRSRKVKHANE